jgi:PIN domain nuclease of toxin-antitoxin system
MAGRLPMNVLLDTNALLVLADGPLPKRAAEAFGLADFAFASPVSAWEVAIKFHLGKLNISPSPLDWFHTLCDRYHLTILPIATETLCAAAALPPIHRDPFDRVLIPGSAIKGVFRDAARHTLKEDPGVIDDLFGPETIDGESAARAGDIAFGEARPLAFPVRSAKGAIFNMECVPAETLFSAPVHVIGRYKKLDAAAALEKLASAHPVLQFAANGLLATIAFCLEGKKHGLQRP